MKLILTVLIVCLASAQGRRALLSCEDASCGPKTPPYNVTGTHGATQIRVYENATWALSFGKSIFGIDVAAAVATKGIFGYFAGANNQHKKISPSVPLITTIAGPPHHSHPPHPPKNGSHPHDDPEHHHHNGTDPERPHPPHNGSHPHPPHNGSHPHPPHHSHGPVVLVGAYIPLEGVLPKPDSPHVKLVKTNTSKVYVHEFGGFAISWLVKREIKHLKIDLKDLGIKPCKGKFFVATYDGPWKILGRKNEVWWTEIPKHHHDHNKTHDESASTISRGHPTPFGFEAMDPSELFPEEAMSTSNPQDSEGLPEFLDLPEAGIENEEAVDTLVNGGDWITEIGQDVAHA